MKVWVIVKGDPAVGEDFGETDNVGVFTNESDADLNANVLMSVGVWSDAFHHEDADMGVKYISWYREDGTVIQLEEWTVDR